MAKSILGDYEDELQAEELQKALAMTAPQPSVEAQPDIAQDDVSKALALTASNGYGAVEPGNIDLSRRPHVKNPDGSISTVRSMGFQDQEGGPEILIPTVSEDGRLLSGDEAIDQYHRTGKHLGKYDSVDASNAAAEAIHNDQETNMPYNSLMDVRKASGSPKKAIAQYNQDYLDNRNQLIETIGRAGDEQAGFADKKAALRADQATQAKGITDEAKANADESRKSAKAHREEADRLYNEMKAHAEPPSRSMGQKIGLVITAVMTAASNKAGAATGLALLNQVLQPDREGWEAAQNQRSRQYNALMAGLNEDKAAEGHEYDVASKLQALRGHEVEAAIAEQAEKSSSADFKSAAKKLQLDAREKTINALTEIEKQKQAALDAAAKAAAAAKRKKQDEWFYEVPLDVLRKAPPQILGKAGFEALSKREKDETDQRIAKAKAQKDESELLSLNDPAKPKTEFEMKAQSMIKPLGGADGPIARLESRLFDKNGQEIPSNKVDVPYMGTQRGGSTWVPESMTPEETLQFNADVNTLKQTFVRLRSGAGVKETEAEDELKAMGVFSKDEKVAAQGLKQLVRSIRASDKFGDLQAEGSTGLPKSFTKGVGSGIGSKASGGDTPRQAPAPRVDPNAPVAMFDDKGRRFEVHPSRVQQAKNMGMKTTQEAGFDPIYNRDQALAQEAAAKAAQENPPIVEGPAMADVDPMKEAWDEYDRKYPGNR